MGPFTQIKITHPCRHTTTHHVRLLSVEEAEVLCAPLKSRLCPDCLQVLAIKNYLSSLMAVQGKEASRE